MENFFKIRLSLWLKSFLWRRNTGN